MVQCKAISKQTKERCKHHAMRGMQVCYNHGGKLGGKKARGARRKAALRHGFYTKESIAKRKETLAVINSIKKSL